MDSHYIGTGSKAFLLAQKKRVQPFRVQPVLISWGRELGLPQKSSPSSNQENISPYQPEWLYASLECWEYPISTLFCSLPPSLPSRAPERFLPWDSVSPPSHPTSQLNGGPGRQKKMCTQPYETLEFYSCHIITFSSSLSDFLVGTPRVESAKWKEAVLVTTQCRQVGERVYSGKSDSSKTWCSKVRKGTDNDILIIFRETKGITIFLFLMS